MEEGKGVHQGRRREDREGVPLRPGMEERRKRGEGLHQRREMEKRRKRGRLCSRDEGWKKGGRVKGSTAGTRDGTEEEDGE